MLKIQQLHQDVRICVSFYWFFVIFSWCMVSCLQSPDWGLPLFQENFLLLYSWGPSLFSVLFFRVSSSTYVCFVFHNWHLISKCCPFVSSVFCDVSQVMLLTDDVAFSCVDSFITSIVVFVWVHFFTEFLVLFIPPSSSVSFYLFCFVS